MLPVINTHHTYMNTTCITLWTLMSCLGWCLLFAVSGQFVCTWITRWPICNHHGTLPNLDTVPALLAYSVVRNSVQGLPGVEQQQEQNDNRLSQAQLTFILLFVKTYCYMSLLCPNPPFPPHPPPCLISLYSKKEQHTMCTKQTCGKMKCVTILYLWYTSTSTCMLLR